MLWLIAILAGQTDSLLERAAFFPERTGGEGAVLPLWLAPLTSLSVHAGFLHLLLTVGAFILFGRAVEPATGWFGVLVLAVAGAHAAAGLFLLIHPIGLPWFGAGGPAGAILGAYAVLFGRDRAGRPSPRAACWRFTLWLCVAWILVALLVTATFAGALAIYYFAAYAGPFAIGAILARPLLLLHYRKA